MRTDSRSSWSSFYEDDSPYILRQFALNVLAWLLISKRLAIRRRWPLYFGARRTWVSRAGRWWCLVCAVWSPYEESRERPRGPRHGQCGGPYLGRWNSFSLLFASGTAFLDEHSFSWSIASNKTLKHADATCLIAYRHSNIGHWELLLKP